MESQNIRKTHSTRLDQDELSAEYQQFSREITSVRLEQNGLEAPLSPPDEWCLLPTSQFNIYGEWGQWDITHHQGDWRKIEKKNLEEDEEITLRRYQCSKKIVSQNQWGSNHTLMDK